MLYQKSKLLLIALMTGLSLLSVACATPGAVTNEGLIEDEASGEQATSDADLAIEAKVVTKTTVLDTAQAPPTEPASPDLPTEIIEPTTPISPGHEAGPTHAPQGATMADDDTAQVIPGSEEALAKAIEDLAQRTGAPPDEITLVSMEAIDWSDTSLGCPQEGFMYAQVITPGYKMILATGGQQYEYHTDQSTSVVFCQP
jgi:hypothetical protein